MAEKAAFDMIGIRSVVLVGRRDFGRCPFAARVPAALWPVAGKPVLERLLCHLADEGIENVALCCADAVSASIEALPLDPRLAVRLVREELSSGTAGCLRDAVEQDPGDLIVVFSGSIVCPPSIRGLAGAHAASEADLTVVFNPGSFEDSSHGTAAEIYLCRPDVLKLIPPRGYCDIKEGLIPAIVRAGGTVKPLVLPQEAGNFHDQAGYLDAISLYLRSDAVMKDGYAVCDRSDRRLASVRGCIDPGARLYGPVAVAEDAHVAEGAVVVGPAILDRATYVGEDSTIVGSVLWEGATVGAGCEVRRSLVSRNAIVHTGSVISEQMILPKRKRSTRRGAQHRVVNVGRGEGGRVEHDRQHSSRVAVGVPLSPGHYSYIAGGTLIGLVLLWSYWPTVTELWREWCHSEEYGAGMLVPPLAAYVVWTRWRDIVSVGVRPMILWGAVALAFTQAIRGLGLVLMYGSAEMLSIVLTVTALTMLLFGWRMVKKLAPVLVFLCLMLPWPHRVRTQISLPLQVWATDSAVFCLELLGYGVGQNGNVITIGQTTEVGVAEACNGLRMITAFLVISGLVVLLVKRAWWEKLIVLASSLPIALFCNTVRLTVTAMFFAVVESVHIRKLIHDTSGYAMMPLALGLVVGEFWLLTRLVTPEVEVTPAVIARRRSEHAVDS